MEWLNTLLSFCTGLSDSVSSAATATADAVASCTGSITDAATALTPIAECGTGIISFFTGLLELLAPLFSGLG
ncbi:MAG: hypothetical protein LBR73_02655 [Oscillospiraceae bacterium]|jgi:hypothetical protein|nr:hypothetical protein [Oscillospiraceae bacterium]